MILSDVKLCLGIAKATLSQNPWHTYRLDLERVIKHCESLLELATLSENIRPTDVITLNAEDSVNFLQHLAPDLDIKKCAFCTESCGNEWCESAPHSVK